jgi:hypothetical protein
VGGVDLERRCAVVQVAAEAEPHRCGDGGCGPAGADGTAKAQRGAVSSGDGAWLAGEVDQAGVCHIVEGLLEP